MSKPSKPILSQKTVDRLIIESLRVNPLTDDQIHELLDAFTEMEVTAAMVKGWHQHKFKLEWDTGKHSFFVGLVENTDTDNISAPSRLEGEKKSPDATNIEASTTKDQNNE
ncbi:MAG: hypothetical protein SOI04_07895 [Bifidobacterium thermacidophilum]|jgi:hypothetical protein|uniref:hypothetical protein n=1 Tax=Bifidobacterium thermacidophilum TaxID=246618 RepID=UPI002F35D929